MSWLVVGSFYYLLSPVKVQFSFKETFAHMVKYY